MNYFTDLDGLRAFRCPGCDCHHYLDQRWTIELDDAGRPTVRPSVVADGQYHCHLFIRAGRIEYLQDCTHGLAGQTVNMEDAEAEEAWAGGSGAE